MIHQKLFLLPLLGAWGSYIKLEPADPMTIPIGVEVSFTCTRNVTQNSIGWIAMLVTGERLYGEENNDRFREFGMAITEVNRTVSTLQIVPINVNLSSLQCQFIHFSTAQPVVSNLVQLSIIEVSQLPMNVSISIEENIVTVNWTTPMPTVMTTEYTLTIIDRLTAVQSAAVIVNNTESYQFDLAAMRQTCHEFEVRISASSMVGTMEAVAISGRFPVLPDSLSHKLLESDGNAILTVNLNVPACSWPSDTNYMLRVIKLDSNIDYGGQCTSNSGGSTYSCQSSRLPMNSHYKFHIECRNQFGNITTTSTRIVSTPHLTGASLDVINSTVVQIQCHYLIGVVIRGCHFTLVPFDQLKPNVSGEILRTNGDVTTVSINSISCYRDLVVTVVDSGATNVLSLPRRIKLNQSIDYQPCSFEAQQLEDSNRPISSGRLAVIIAVPMACAVLIAIIMGGIVALSAVFYSSKLRAKTKALIDSESTYSGEKSASTYSVERTSIDKMKAVSSSEQNRHNVISPSSKKFSHATRS